MIPNVGAIELLDDLLPTIAGAQFRLFVNDEVITSTSVRDDLTEASWSGYAAVNISSFTTPSIVSGKASASAVTSPYFVNSSGSPVTFYGWYVADSVGGPLIAAQNIGETTIPDGQGYLFALTATLRQDPS